jgi:endogenous inhibitor of DNA gyrase (YacG/DUF329 family)
MSDDEKKLKLSGPIIVPVRPFDPAFSAPPSELLDQLNAPGGDAIRYVIDGLQTRRVQDPTYAEVIEVPCPTCGAPSDSPCNAVMSEPCPTCGAPIDSPCTAVNCTLLHPHPERMDAFDAIEEVAMAERDARERVRIAAEMEAAGWKVIHPKAADAPPVDRPRIRERFEVFAFKPVGPGERVRCPRCGEPHEVTMASVGASPFLVLLCGDDAVGLLSWLQTRDVV